MQFRVEAEKGALRQAGLIRGKPRETGCLYGAPALPFIGLDFPSWALQPLTLQNQCQASRLLRGLSSAVSGGEGRFLYFAVTPVNGRAVFLQGHGLVSLFRGLDSCHSKISAQGVRARGARMARRKALVGTDCLDDSGH